LAFKLVFRQQDRRVERTLLGARVTLGRDPANHIVIDDPARSISRFHARFESAGDQKWRIVDTRSTNRIRVNGELIDPEEAGARTLADGDTLVLGSFEMRFVREEEGTVVLEKDKSAANSVTLRTVLQGQDLPALIGAGGAARLPPEAEEAIERAKRAVGVLSVVGRRIAAVTPVDDIIDAIVDLVFDATPAERAALFLWDEDGQRLVPKRTRSREADDLTPVTVSQSLVQRAFDEKAVAQLDPEAKTSESTSRLGLLSAVAVPLLAESKAVGVIYADTRAVSAAFDAFGVALLSALATHAAIAIEQTRLLRKARQEERWRLKLVQYLAPGVVDRILSTGESTPGLRMSAEEVEVTVLFCDMAGFTSRTEKMDPHDVLLLLNRCFSAMTEVVQELGGTVDKYIGDCLMAVFGAPFPQPDHARRAALAALGLRDAIDQVNAQAGTAQAEVGFRIGMHSGKAVAGDVGHVTRRNWTVLGSTVNLASRMESSVARPGQIVLTGDTRAGLGDEFELKPIETVQPPKGITRGFTAYELLGFREGRTPS
jgi:adenylate cyclase